MAAGQGESRPPLTTFDEAAMPAICDGGSYEMALLNLLPILLNALLISLAT